MKQFDIIVVGGGMVGAATALGLARLGKHVAMIERAPPQPFLAEQVMDLRVSAISHGSVNFLTSLDVWGYVSQMRLCPYRRIETWEDTHCRLGFTASQLDLPELGFIVENRLIQLALWQACEAEPNVTVFSPAQIVNMFADVKGHVVELDTGEPLYAGLIAGADGANSRVREYANIGVTAWDYRQHCMLVNVQTALPQQDMTWQWFTPTGPRAFLPLQGHHASLVWYDSPSRIKDLCAMSSARLREEILAHFPKQLGDITVCQQGAFPLTRRHAQKYYHKGVFLLGDAAHTINPLAGQGVNLGFKDVKALLTVVEEMGIEPNSHNDKLLAAYEQKRKPDNLIMQTGMDFLYHGFSHQSVPLKILRNIGITLAENSGWMKNKVLKYAMGL